MVGGFWHLAIHSEDGKGVFMFRYQLCGGEETLVLAVETAIISSVHASPA